MSCPECGSETFDAPKWGPHVEDCEVCTYFEWIPAKPTVKSHD